MQIRHLYSNYFFVVLIGCSRHLMLTACEVFDIHRLGDNAKMNLIYISIAVKFGNLAYILNFYY